MREIKFRAWDPDKKTMYVPEWIDGKFGEPWHQIWQDDAVFPDGKNIVVMQETGLKDKNGKEIYEGDIVRFVYHRPHIETIEWLDGAAGFDPFKTQMSPMTVIRRQNQKNAKSSAISTRT